MKAGLGNPLLWVTSAILMCVGVIAVTQVISCRDRWQDKPEMRQSAQELEKVFAGGDEFRQKAKRDAARSQIGAFQSGIDLYQLSLETYPPNLEALRVAPTSLPDPAKWDGPFLIKEIPLDPWGNEYRYAFPGKRNPETYDLWSAGPDGKDNTGDDISVSHDLEKPPLWNPGKP